MTKMMNKPTILLILVLLGNLNLYAQQPNILWLTCEDISPTLSMYGDSTAHTPNLDRLAAESIVFTEAFATVGVCAPSRSSMITGRYPVSIGTHQMRTGRDVYGWGSRKYSGDSGARDINGALIPHYSTVVPSDVKCFPEFLREAGYFCTNNAKTDVQFAVPVTAFDENSRDAHWRHRKKDQPFFAIFNHEVTHESKMWKHKDLPLTVNPEDVPLPDYYPDNEEIRKGVARNYSNIELLDQQIGEKIAELEAAGELDNTIIFFFSDHGGPLPRGKREHYVSGLRVPLMVRLPKNLRSQRVDIPVSFVDLAPTVLAMAGIEKPGQFQGENFLKDGQPSVRREFIFGTGDRFDEFADRIRSVISKDFVYVRNYHPELSAYKDVGYRRNMDMMNELYRLHEAGELSADQAYWFRPTKTKEEFYVRSDDPHSLHNLIDDERYLGEIKRMRKALKRWQKEVKDMGKISEKKVLAKMWPDGIQPMAAKPETITANGMVRLNCATKGASIAYLISKKDFTPDLDAGWQLYSSPVRLQAGEKLYAMGTRIGFADSEVLKVNR